MTNQVRINVNNHAVTIASMQHTEIRILPVVSVGSGLNSLDINWNEHGEHTHSNHFNVFFLKTVTETFRRYVFWYVETYLEFIA